MVNSSFHNPLFDKIKEYFKTAKNNNSTIFIFVPYIKLKILQELFSKINSKAVIVTTWKTSDLISGSSELTIYPFCRSKGIAVYINNKIHLKVYSVALENMIVATGNISENGLMPDLARIVPYERLI